MIFSCSGKTSQYNDHCGKVVINSLSQLRKLENDNSIQPTSFRVVGPSVVATFKKKDDAVETFLHGTMMIAAPCTG